MAEPRHIDQPAQIRAAARELDRDRYLAALLAPSPARDDLLTLAAFHGEIARIPATVSEPTIAAIRLQWWRDQLEGAAWEPATASPVADAMCRLVVGKDAQLRDAISIIDAYEDLLRPGALDADGAVSAYAAASQGAAFRLAAHILGASDATASPIIAAAGQSYARVQLLRILPLVRHRGHDPLREPYAAILDDARAAYAEVRRHAAQANRPIRQAILPAALVGPYLKALEGLGPQLAVEQATISPLSRVWRIYVADRFGRF
jgi:phytoene synthase